MSITKIAIPSALPGGLQAQLGQHFGHCDVFTLVDVEDGKVVSVNTLENAPHEHGGCMAPVLTLSNAKVQVMLAGGMGMRPLAGFNQVGIRVFYVAHCTTVAQAVQGYIANGLQEFTSDYTCKGGSGHCQH